MIRAVAIDDEIPALSLLENFCNRTEGVELVKKFNIPAEALKYLNKYPVDVLFLDINMPSMSGIELYKAIRQQTMVIFTTAYSEFAVEGFNLNAVDYLLKPFTYKRFQQAVKKATDLQLFQNEKKSGNLNFLFIRADYALLKIDISEIIYIEALDDYLKIYLASQKTITARMTLKTIIEKLPSIQFIRIHRSYIVAVKSIKSLRNKTIFIGDVELPIGSSFEENVLKSINK